jgi:hypothetical protein
VPIQVWVDDSGGEDQVVQVTAGLIGRTEEWAVFSERWARILAESPTVPLFKMHDAAALTGHFYGFSQPARDAKVKKLAELIAESGFNVIHVTLDMAGFDATFKVYPRSKPLNKPYFHAFHIMIMAVGYELLDRGERERFEIIFDEHKALGEKAKRWYPVVREANEAAIQALLPVEPLFRDDSDFLPLQAADMMAWLCRRDTIGEDYPFGWLAPVFSRMTVSEYSQFLDRKRMEGILSRAAEVYERLTPEDVARAKKLLGLA